MKFYDDIDFYIKAISDFYLASSYQVFQMWISQNVHKYDA